MKKVAILADGWKKYVNYAWVAGSRKYIEDNQADVNLYFFNCFGNYSPDELYNQGEYNIFNLPDYKQFDGILLELTNVTDGKMREKILSDVIASGVPAISLLEDIPELYFAGTDNYKAMMEIVDHMIEVHDCKKLNYIGGPQSNFENRVRYRAFQDSLKKHGIPLDDSRAFFLDFEIDSGIQGFYHFQKRNLLPDAFICANDNLAVGVCHAAEEAGFSVPEDFIVTGYDNFDKASYFQPRITTVDFSREEIAYNAMDMLARIWRGEHVEHASLVEAECIFQESCGCPKRFADNRGHHIAEIIMAEDRDRKISNEMLLLKRELTNCRSFQEMAACIPKHLIKLSYDEFYILINQEIADCNELPQLDAAGDEEYRTEGYPDNMDVLLACLKDFVLSIKERGPGRLIPGNEEDDSGNLYLFSPLHFRDREVGYIVLKNCDYLMDSQMMFEAMNVMQESMENLYHKIILNRMNQELAQLYIRDSLTGMYNRMAYQKLAVPLFERCRQQKTPLTIMFVDLDRLKYINDNFGHDMGNIAIRTIANSITNVTPEDGVAMRYGGDEFVILIPSCDEDKAGRLVKKLNREILMERNVGNTGFEIGASVGYVVTTEQEGLTMNDYINIADDRMYAIKKAKKEARKA